MNDDLNETGTPGTSESLQLCAFVDGKDHEGHVEAQWREPITVI